MKTLAVCAVIISAILGLTQSTSAHVLITDDTNSKGAVLHIMPDDDPVAGEPATLYFDTQTTFGSRDSVTLRIKDAAGQETEVDTQIAGSLATATNVFPAQGIYDLEFTVRTGSNVDMYTQSQRVSRGAATSALDTKHYGWAEILLLASVLGCVVLAITAINNRKEIAQQSKFK